MPGKSMDVLTENKADGLKLTTVQMTKNEKAALMATAATTAEFENMSALSVRELINKMHAAWKKDLSKRKK